MRRVTCPALVLLGLSLAGTASAQDDWDDEDELPIGQETDVPNDKKRMEQGDDLDSKADEADESLDEFADPEDNEDILGEDGLPTTSDSGDSPTTYRQAQESVKDAPPDEEFQVWEDYLAQYPKTVFRDRIQKRMAELEQAMYSGGGIEGDDGIGDAMDQEIGFSQALLLENIDPRTRLQFGAEWGLPAYINLFADFEYALARTFSFHAGVRRRYTGYSIEPGVHWALVKSTRTETIVTLIADLRINTIPAYPGFRPQLAFGKRLGIVDLGVQAGSDLTLRKGTTLTPGETEAVIAPAIVGGLSLTVDASDTVKVFTESAVFMRFNDSGSFRYNTVTFGMKFFPKKDRRTEQTSDDVEVNMGATVPYTYNYWTYHYGSVMVQSNLYL